MSPTLMLAAALAAPVVAPAPVDQAASASPLAGASFAHLAGELDTTTVAAPKAEPERPPVPEPQSVALMLAGLASVVLVVRRRRR